MNETYFQTFLQAVAICSDREGILGKEFVVFPPSPDYGYEATPKNAVTFAAMGVDGVHYAIIEIDGAVDDGSPVIHVSPMDFSEEHVVLADSFLSYVAAACGISVPRMAEVFQEERARGDVLIPFLKQYFASSRLYEETRLAKLKRFLRYVKRRE